MVAFRKGSPLHWPHRAISSEGKGSFSVDRKEFSHIRRHLGKTQSQLAQLLGTSLKAVQSFEQGWRKIPVHIERQLLFLLAMKRTRDREQVPCWVIERCPMETRHPNDYLSMELTKTLFLADILTPNRGKVFHKLSDLWIIV
jgi:DNA-binding XRE family transcriptional regulator